MLTTFPEHIAPLLYTLWCDVLSRRFAFLPTSCFMSHPVKFYRRLIYRWLLFTDFSLFFFPCGDWARKNNFSNSKNDWQFLLYCLPDAALVRITICNLVLQLTCKSIRAIQTKAKEFEIERFKTQFSKMSLYWNMKQQSWCK